MIKESFDIAVKNLRTCYGKNGIFAGKSHFKDYWARDSFFASFGCLKIGDYEIVKTNLQLFQSNMSKTGQLPLRVGRRIHEIILGKLKLRKEHIRKPIYRFDFNNKTTVDQNSLFIICASQYVKTTKDDDYLNSNIHVFEKIINWNFKNDKNNDLLIEEDELCNWADSVKKKGAVLYTNVCHCYALKCMAHLLKKFSKHKSEHYLKLHLKVKDKINELFWNGEHYIDWIYKGNHYNYFSTDGNMLAILWDIADKTKARHIEEAAHIFELNEIPSQCVYPNYPSKYISKEAKLLGVPDYHNGMSWLWLGCINAIAKNKIGMKNEARRLIEKISALILEYNNVYEVYEKSGRPVSRILYKSENPFAWSAGLFIYSVLELSLLDNK